MSKREERDLTRALAESEQRLRALFDNVACGVLQTDGDNRLAAVNDRLCEMLGYPRDELLGKTIHDLTCPDDRPHSDQVHGQIRAGTLRSTHYEQRCLKRDGSPLWVQVGVSAAQDEAGRYLFSIGTLLDISARKDAEAQIRLHAAALEAAPSAISLSKTDQNGTIVWVNPAFTALTGYTAEEAIGRTHRLLSSGVQDDAFYRDLWNTIRRGGVWRGELVNRRKDGTVYQEEMGITPLRDEAGHVTHYVAIKQDISARKAAEAALTAAKQAADEARQSAEEASHGKDRFLAVLSHELRTPLAPVVTGLALLQGDASLPDRVRMQLAIMRRNVELESRLIDDLLDLTRIARGRVELERRRVDLRTILERAVEVCRPDIDARHLHFGVDAGADTYPLDADPARLQQVFWNLLKNSIKFTPLGGCVGIRCRRENGHAVVEVNDSGVGIEPPALEHLFDAFAQQAESPRPPFGGLGLGLAISKAFVELHGGTIAARSAGRDRGTTISVRLPLLPIFADAAASAASTAVDAGRPLPSLRILLVEDHGDTAEMMAMVLEHAGHHVETAGDVATALRAAAAGTFDLILSDLGLPDRSGVDLMRELRARGNKLPAIALSGYGQEQDIERSREAGFDAHLVKPVDPHRLDEAIELLVHPPSRDR